MAAISISAVGVLALSGGAGVAASWGGNESGVVDLAAIDVQLPASFTDSGDGSSELAEPVGTNGSNGRTGSDLEVNEAAAPLGEPVTQPVRHADTRLVLPPVLLSDLNTRLAQGRKLYDMGLYLVAGETLIAVREDAIDALSRYGNSDSLQGIVEQAGSYLEKAQKECRILNQDSCP